MTDFDTPKQPVLRHNREASRFELEVEGQISVLEYMRDGSTLIYTHTEVPPALRGRDLAAQLTRYGLDYARAEGLGVRALCSYTAKYIERHPEYQDITEGY